MIGVINLPELSIEIDGNKLGRDILQNLRELRVHQKLSLPSLCEMILTENDKKLFDTEILVPGAMIKVYVEKSPDPIFSGQITACYYDHGPSQQCQIKVRGYDILHKLRKRRNIKAQSGFTLAQLAHLLVADLGVNVEAIEEGPIFQQAVQFRQSDFELLQEIAERSNLYFILRNNVLFIISLKGLGAPVPLSLGTSLLQASIEVNADPLCRSVTLTGWNPRNAQTTQSKVKKPSVKRAVSEKISEKDFGTDATYFLVDETIQNEEQGIALAQAELDRQAAREVCFWGTAEGDPGLQPGTPIDVNNLSRSFNGHYVLTEVSHVINQIEGYVTKFNTLPPKKHVRQKSTITTIGRVSQVEDPENLGRVCVILSNYGNVETGWCQVVIPGAGKKKGIIALPNVNDQVLVLLINEDPAEAIVLGGVYGNLSPPDSGISKGETVRFTLTTAQGQQISLDDVKKTLRIENNKGSFVELTPDVLRIHSATGLVIEAPGENIEICGKNIDFKQV